MAVSVVPLPAISNFLFEGIASYDLSKCHYYPVKIGLVGHVLEITLVGDIF